MKFFILGLLCAPFIALFHEKVLRFLVGERCKYRIWPFIDKPFYNLKNRFFHNFLWDLEYKRHMKTKKPFKDKQLIYSSHARCKCGEGLAYPRGIGFRGKWDCAGVLTGRINGDAVYEKSADNKFLHEEYPFSFYEIKSENQPSAYGATTRPKKG